MATKYLDLVGGNDANDGSSFANRKLTLASAMSVMSAGDTLRVMKTPNATSVGDATWTNGSSLVTLASAVTANISDCQTAWTAAANVTATASTSTYRENTAAASLVIASGFTTGKVAHFDLGSAQDFSAYQQVSFWMRTNGTLADGVLTLRLCSDTTGDTVVNTIAIPSLVANYWNPVTVDLGGALGSSIRSISVSAASDPGAITLFLDNIIACKAASDAASLTLRSLIGKGTTDEPYFAIQSINGTSVRLHSIDPSVASGALTVYETKYRGATATVTTYKVEPINLTAALAVSVAGASDSAPTVVDGGWNATDMSTKTGITWLQALKPAISCMNFGGTNQTIGGFGLVCGSAASGVAALTSQNCVTDVDMEFTGRGGAAFRGSAAVVIGYRGFKYMVGGGLMLISGTSYSSAGMAPEIYRGKFVWGRGSSGSSTEYLINIDVTLRDPALVRLEIDEVAGFYALLKTNLAAELDMRRVTLSDLTYEVDLPLKVAVSATDCTFANGTYGMWPTDASAIKLTRVGGVPGVHYRAGSSGSGNLWSWQTVTDVTHGSSGIAWRADVQTGVVWRRIPARLPIARIACNAGEARTVSAWFRRSHADILARLVVEGRMVSGLTADVEDSLSAAVDTWEELSITFTPDEDCVAEVHAEAWGSLASGNAWVSDMAVS